VLDNTSFLIYKVFVKLNNVRIARSQVSLASLDVKMSKGKWWRWKLWSNSHAETETKQDSFPRIHVDSRQIGGRVSLKHQSMTPRLPLHK
jgi:hypothetical protein